MNTPAHSSPAALRPPPPADRRSHRHAARLAVGLLTACLLVAVSAGSAAGAPALLQATQELAVLHSGHVAYTAPQPGSPTVAQVSAQRPITGERTTLPVLTRTIGAGGSRWLQVMLPGRPAGLTGWISEKGTSELVTPWRMTVDLGARRVSVYNNGHRVRSFQAVIGKPSTPTPTGQFFVEEVVQMPSGEPGGPFALALSARSNVLQEFEGGPGQIGIHGRDNLGGTVGQAESHGCMRVATSNIDWLAAKIHPGTPVLINAGG
jgi:lipoprotein-anchoring transpeptidase ErfK/SrfK